MLPSLRFRLCCGWLEARLPTLGFPIFVAQVTAYLNKPEKRRSSNSTFYLITQYAKSFQAHSPLVNQLGMPAHQKRLYIFCMHSLRLVFDLVLLPLECFDFFTSSMKSSASICGRLNPIVVLDDTEAELLVIFHVA